MDHRQTQPDESGWSGAENQMLLAGLELFGDDWGKVADHVGTRSQVRAGVGPGSGPTGAGRVHAACAVS